jgi:hypothetical protein
VSAGTVCATCEFKNAPRILVRDGHETVTLFSESSSPDFWAKASVNNPILDDYESWVRNHTNVDQIFLLKRQRAIFAKYNQTQDVKLFDQVIKGRIGAIVKPSCLEELLLAQHLQNAGRYAFAEYGAYVLENDADQTLKVYFATNKEASVTFPPMILDAVVNDLKAGYALRAFVHNHPFIFDGEDIGGTDIGSTPDFMTFGKYAKQLGLQSARITNGFNTIVYFPEDLQKALSILQGTR